MLSIVKRRNDMSDKQQQQQTANWQECCAAVAATQVGQCPRAHDQWRRQRGEGEASPLWVYGNIGRHIIC